MIYTMGAVNTQCPVDLQHQLEHKPLRDRQPMKLPERTTKGVKVRQPPTEVFSCVWCGVRVRVHICLLSPRSYRSAQRYTDYV